MSSLAYPFHVSQEAIEQSFERNKFDGFLSTFNVPMIAFPALVVIAQDAFTVHDEASLYLKGCVLPGTGVGRPQNDLEKGRVINHRPPTIL
jgi:hypothetical protein